MFLLKIRLLLNILRTCILTSFISRSKSSLSSFKNSSLSRSVLEIIPLAMTVTSPAKNRIFDIILRTYIKQMWCNLHHSSKSPKFFFGFGTYYCILHTFMMKIWSQLTDNWFQTSIFEVEKYIFEKIYLEKFTEKLVRSSEVKCLWESLVFRYNVRIYFCICLVEDI